MYVVTGGAGFIGSALIWELNRQGYENVIIVDNLDSSEKWRNLVPLRYADYLSRETFIDMIRNGAATPWNVAAVIHLGACSDTAEPDSGFLVANNFHFSRDLCQWAVCTGARYIQASSAATYGDGSRGFVDNEDALTTLRPLNMYAYSKQMFDVWAQDQRLSPRFATLKFFNVYGPNEYHKEDMRSVVNKAHAQILATGRLRLFRSTHPDYPDGGQMRDFVYVKDVVKVMSWFLSHPEVNGVFNVGTGRARTFNDLARAVFTAMDRPVDIEYVDMPDALRGKYQNYTCAVMDKLLATGCPGCSTSLEDGVADYVQNYLNTHAYLDGISR